MKWFMEKAVKIARTFLKDDSIDIEVIEEMEDNLRRMKEEKELSIWWKGNFKINLELQITGRENDWRDKGDRGCVDNYFLIEPGYVKQNKNGCRPFQEELIKVLFEREEKIIILEASIRAG